MSSRRILASVAAMTAVVAIGAWSAVSLFPLTETVFAQGRAGAVSVPQGQAGPAGPLERQAKPITPENPIPRRTFFVLPRNPSTPAGGVTIASARIVIDRQGRVVEARGTGAGVRGGGSAESNGPPIESFVRALVDAVRQWQYDPPADGPIAFDVAFAFVPGTEPRLITHGSPVPGALAGLPVAPPSPPPPPPPPGWGRGAIRVGNDVKPPQKTRHVAPVYPQAAQAAHVQGVVILEAIIGEDGKVQDARVLRSIPLLDQAALDAVRGWEFMPTLLNGAPVSVMMTVTIQFTLS